MRRTFLFGIPLFALLLAGLLRSQQSFMQDPAWVGSLTPLAVGGDGCGTGNLLFSWHCESTNVTEGIPPGCSVGDEVGDPNTTGATISALQFYDGSNSLYVTNSDVRFAADIVSSTAGTWTFYFYLDTFVSTAPLMVLYYDANDYIRVRLQGTDDATGRELRVQWYTTGGAGTDTEKDTTDADLAKNTWYKVTFKYQAAGDPNLSIQVGASSTFTANVDPGTLAGTPSVRIGSTAAGSSLYIDEVKTYDAVMP